MEQNRKKKETRDAPSTQHKDSLHRDAQGSALATSYRDVTCGALRIGDVGRQVRLCGWVFRLRIKKHVIFLDLRDAYGITQIFFEHGRTDQALFESAAALQREYVIAIRGQVVARYAKNPALVTGDIEVFADTLQVLSKADSPPFTLEDNSDGGHDLRMRYRYLDIRRGAVQKQLWFKHQLCQQIRGFLSAQGFVEIETPLLVKSTPEGARDFLVPARLYPNQYYALPQSPQLFKQLLMIGGTDRYFQLARCFRDEDYRLDRQPEFTQLDCELSFVNQTEVMQVFEALIKHLFRTLLGVSLGDFPQLSYAQSMERYGTDKPDVRLQWQEVTQRFGAHPMFAQAEQVWALRIEGAATLSRKALDTLSQRLHVELATRFAYIQYTQEGMRSPLRKNMEEQSLAPESLGAHTGDMIVLVGGEVATCYAALLWLHNQIHALLPQSDTNTFAPLWVKDFPLFSVTDEQYHSMHHPFTCPQGGMEALMQDPGGVMSFSHDLVINGVEIGGGSMRIADKQLQSKVFELLGMSIEEQKHKFGFFLEALQYGVPPHGGIAIGIDRLCAIMQGGAIRNYIAFPKNSAARDTMQEAPSEL